MGMRAFSEEARLCRGYADDVALEHERAILLHIAQEFDRLAGIATFYETRARQEVAAAVEAQHPKARLAHLTLARRYDQLAQRTEMTA